ncbi:MAG: NAD-dependent epimerase/dehydratase family protein [Thermoplasmata archaeon]
MSILGITGGAGYVGNLLARIALEGGWSVRCVDNLSGPISLRPSGVPFLREDFYSEAGLSFLADADVIVHLGAVSGVVACARAPEETQRTNVLGTSRLVAACEQRRAPLAFASSLAAVGAPDRMPITEATSAAPTHEYARQKAEGERLVDHLSSAGVRAAVVRMSNVYGTYTTEGRTVAKGNVVNEFVRQAVGGVLRVNAPGTQRRDFIHIDDIVRAWLALAEQLARGPATMSHFLFARGRSYSVSEIAELALHAWAAANPGRGALRAEIVENPRGAIELLDERFEVDPSRTWASLGRSPAHRLETDLADLFASPPPGT